MWIVTLSTPHFQFIAGDRSKVTAENAMRRAWTTHAEQTGARLTFDELRDGGSLQFFNMRAGRAYRDDSIIVDEVRP
jgi:hypothetical protein